MKAIIRNEFIAEEKKKNGQIEGTQSLHNKRLYLFSYDNKLGDFVGKWVENPMRCIMEHKYEYTLNGTKYFIVCTQEERFQFEARYGVYLSLVD